MKRGLATVIVGAFLLGFLTANAAVPPKPGATCKKLGLVMTSGNLKYTCIKSGKKLLWNKGIAIKNVPPNTTPTNGYSSTNTGQSVPKGDYLSSDSRISSVSALTPISTCKTIDLTPIYGKETIATNGFPRPQQAIYSEKRAKILVIPFKNASWPFTSTLPAFSNQTMSDLESLKTVNTQLAKFVKELSAGNFEYEIEILPEKDWWILDYDQKLSMDSFPRNRDTMQEFIKRNDGKIDFGKYDSYVFISSLRAQVESVAQASFVAEIQTSKGIANKLVWMTLPWSNTTVFFHELGHSLYGLEDLYLKQEVAADWLPQELSVALPWDVMANAGKSSLTNWNRLLMGWLQDTDVRCLADQSHTIHYLSTFTIPSQPKLLLINLSPGVTLAAEVRSAGTNQGLLLYVIDTHLYDGQGPIRSINTLVKAGETKELFDWKFHVLGTSKEGILVDVSRTSGNKYLPPVQKTQSPNVEEEDKPKPGNGEIAAIDYLKARATWDITNYKSYRIYVTTAEDPNKKLFDTGIINDSKTPLKVEISGLVCGKDFITSVQFWKDSDGKGATIEITSPQLRRWNCK